MTRKQFNEYQRQRQRDKYIPADKMPTNINSGKNYRNSYVGEMTPDEVRLSKKTNHLSMAQLKKKFIIKK